MNQSSYIAAFLLAGFVLFLAANNRLNAYAAVLWGEPSGSGTSGQVNSSGMPNNPNNVTLGGISGPNSGTVNGAGQAIPSINLGVQSVQNLFTGLAAVGSFFGL